MKPFAHYFFLLSAISIISLAITGSIRYLSAEQARSSFVYMISENQNSGDTPDDGIISAPRSEYGYSNPDGSSSSFGSADSPSVVSGSKSDLPKYAAASTVIQRPKVKPAVAQPGNPTPSPSPAARTTASLPAKVSLDKLIGQTEKQVVSMFGLPDSKVFSEYGFNWSVYHRDYKKFIMIGIDGGKVVGVYSNSTFLRLLDCTVGTSRSAVREALSSGYGNPLSGIMKGTAFYKISNLDQKDVFSDGTKYVTAFYDNLESGALTSVQIIANNTEMSIPYFGIPSAGLSSAYAKTSFFLINSIRARKGLPALIWNDSLAAVAQAHSADMGTGLFFSHTGSDGSTVSDRLSAAGIRYANYAENIAKNHPSAIAAHESLMNSSAHRDNILGSSKYLGVGVYMDHKAVLITQDFIS